MSTMHDPAQLADFFSRSGLNPNDPYWPEMFRKANHIPDPDLVRKFLSFLISGRSAFAGEEPAEDEKAVKMLEFYMLANHESFKKLAE